MNDRELLELAYKAANGGTMLWDDKDVSKHWNPLNDDAQAMRLAIRLHINLVFESYVVEASTELNKSLRVAEFTSSDITLQQATRRAIVRAAAEIFKEQP